MELLSYDVIDADSSGLRQYIEFSLQLMVVIEIRSLSSRAILYSHHCASIELNLEISRSSLSKIDFERLAVKAAAEAFEIETKYENFDFFVVYRD